MSAWSPLPVVPCPTHGAPCLLKTGTSDGPSKGRSFFMCSFTNGGQRCDFVQKAPSIPPHSCPRHGGMVELQGIRLSNDQQLLSYRCKLRTNTNDWCGKELFTLPNTTATDSSDSKMQVDPQSWQNPRHSKENLPPSTQVNLDVQHGKRDRLENLPVRESARTDSGRLSDEMKANVPPAHHIQPEESTSSMPTSQQQARLPSEGQLQLKEGQLIREQLLEANQPREHKDQQQYLEQVQQNQQILQQRHHHLQDPQQHQSHHSELQPRNKPLPDRQYLIVPKQSGGEQKLIHQGQQNAVSGVQQAWLEQAVEPQPLGHRKEHKFTFTKGTQVQQKDDNLAEVEQMLSNVSLARQDSTTALSACKDGLSETVKDVSGGRLTTSMASSAKDVVHMGRSEAGMACSTPATSSSNMSSVLLAARLHQHEDLLARLAKSLPDGGARLRDKCKQLRDELEIQREREKLEKHEAMCRQETAEVRPSAPVSNLSVAAAGCYQPYAVAPSLPSCSTGKATAAPLVQPVNLYLSGTDRLDYYKTRSVARQVTDMLHKQLESCPPPTTLAEDPAGLRVNLMEHQRHALAWLRWREQQSPSGGVLADDMGLGKTLTMISLVLKHKQDPDGCKVPTKEESANDLVKSHASLVVCPASLVLQWKAEVERRVGGRRLSVLVHHGSSRTKEARELARYDIVITTYGVVQTEAAAHIPEDEGDGQKRKKAPKAPKRQAAACPLLEVDWLRVILDEAHTIRNPKCSTSKSVCLLPAERRWALTGTPIQNNLLDMYSLLKFLRCHPFDDFKVWKLLVDNSKRGVATARLNSVVKALLLRRTKDQTTAQGEKLISLPSRAVVTHDIVLSEEERGVYDAIFSVSKSVVAAYIERAIERAEERGDPTNIKPVNVTDVAESAASSSSAATRYINQCLLDRVCTHMKECGPGGVVLSLLLRLRQCCCHLGLLTHEVDKSEVDAVEIPLEQQLLGLSLHEDTIASALKDASTEMPKCFKTSSLSTKIASVVECLCKVRRDSDHEKPMKSVVVSQWTRMLDIIAAHLKRHDFRCCRIDGSMTTQKRQAAVENFNNDPKGPEVMLLSLAAGGVGLNLVGGNHLFLMDLHWNPALEKQAFDRIYRVGQTRDVTIHKFISKGTIERRIIELQDKKLQLADGVLTGGAVSSKKLSLQDLRQLFDI